MTKKLQIRDLTLRDGQQSLFATRMKQENVDKLLPLYRDAKFYIMEVWGGAVPDSVMRYLGESPWNRLRECRAYLFFRLFPVAATCSAMCLIPILCSKVFTRRLSRTVSM